MPQPHKIARPWSFTTYAYGIGLSKEQMYGFIIKDALFFSLSWPWTFVNYHTSYINVFNIEVLPVLSLFCFRKKEDEKITTLFMTWFTALAWTSCHRIRNLDAETQYVYEVRITYLISWRTTSPPGCLIVFVLDQLLCVTM